MLRRNRRKFAFSLLVVAIAFSIGLSAFIYIPRYYQGLVFASSDEKAGSVDRDLVAANTKFALAIFKELQIEDEGKNIFISPLSISTALAMAYNGANGSTKEAMAEALKLSGMELINVNRGYLALIDSLENVDNQVELSIANSMWIEKAFEPRVLHNFTKSITDYYRAGTFTRNFGDTDTVGEINNWVREKTNGKIDRIVEKIDPWMVMFLINAIYFKGDWVKKFDPSKTSKADFFLPDNRTIKTDMMFEEGSFSYKSGEDFEAARLPYGRDKIAMYVFLPRENITLDSFIGGLSQTGLDEYINGFSRPSIPVELRLPKFNLEYGSKRLNDVLTRLGMGIAFDPHAADLRGIAPVEPPENLFIAYVDHKAVVEVNEQGTEAAAVTNVGIGLVSKPLTIEFTVNRPFFFVIRDDRSGSILFMGKVVNPNQSISP